MDVHADSQVVVRIDRAIQSAPISIMNARGPEAQTAFVAASRVVFSQILLDEKKGSAVAFLKAALAYYASLVTCSGVRGELIAAGWPAGGGLEKFTRSKSLLC